MIGEFASKIPDFGGDYAPAVGRGLETRRLAVLADELVAYPVEAFGEVEEAVHRASLLLACCNGPGEEGSVACNLVYLAAVLLAAVGEQLVVVLQEAAVLHVPEFFGECGGVAQVHHHEHEIFFERFLRLAEQRVPENARPELLVHRAHEGDEVRHQEEHEQGHLHRRFGKFRDDGGDAVFVHHAFANLRSEQQYAEDGARADCRDEVRRAHQQGFPYRPAVHLVPEDKDVVHAVRKPHEQGELEHRDRLGNVGHAELGVAVDY